MHSDEFRRALVAGVAVAVVSRGSRDRRSPACSPVYATGGVAVTTLKFRHRLTATGGNFDQVHENASASETVAGWTLGGGVEIPIMANATLKTEYLFTRFGNVTTNDNKIFSEPQCCSAKCCFGPRRGCMRGGYPNHPGYRHAATMH
jgi:opacity protein-like surface antigen